MEQNKLIIVGSSGHAKVVLDNFERSGTHDILGLLDDFRNVGEETMGYKVLGGLSDLQELRSTHGTFEVFVAVGDNWARHKVVQTILRICPETKFASIVHPSAQIGKDVIVGKGVAIMASAVVNSGARVGDFSFINTKASVDHDVKMGKYSSIGPNVTLGGNVEIGDFAAVSIGAIAIQKLMIGAHALIGAGALLLTDCPDYTIMYGHPAKEVRKRNAGDAYL